MAEKSSDEVVRDNQTVGSIVWARVLSKRTKSRRSFRKRPSKQLVTIYEKDTE